MVTAGLMLQAKAPPAAKAAQNRLAPGRKDLLKSRSVDAEQAFMEVTV